MCINAYVNWLELVTPQYVFPSNHYVMHRNYIQFYLSRKKEGREGGKEGRKEDTE
jgi:hypothetical protein